MNHFFKILLQIAGIIFKPSWKFYTYARTHAPQSFTGWKYVNALCNCVSICIVLVLVYVYVFFMGRPTSVPLAVMNPR